ncbi:CREB-binding protein [Monomorium pharaonis]|uniref:CREB-binding protein n=1 Tax=Monomorium pharaonis TaxID=307658 RepID=UPI00063F2E09|nr:CREB-binding protein [Monomorium pharaonis]
MDADQQDRTPEQQARTAEQQAQPQTQVPVPDIPLSLPSVSSLAQAQSDNVPTGGQPNLQQATQKKLTDAKSMQALMKYSRYIQQQLGLLFHVHQCQQHKNQANSEMRQCTLSGCKFMKNVLTHITSCQAGKNCTNPHCRISKQIVNHLKHHHQKDCSVCLLINQAIKKMIDSKEGTKEWRTFVTRGLRAHNIHKMVNVVYLNPDPLAKLDRRMHNVIMYVRKMEAEIFKRANSRVEYFDLLVKKIYKMQLKTAALLTTSKCSDEVEVFF